MSRSKKSFGQWLIEATETPEQREQREAEEEERTRGRVRKRLYADLAKKGTTREEVDEGLRRLEDLMERGSR